jgi:hypothetical protein
MSRNGPDAVFRRKVLQQAGATDEQCDELLTYTASPYQLQQEPSSITLPLPEERHVDAWRRYERRAEQVGALEALRSVFVQLRFPIASGMGEDPHYQRATRRGQFEEAEAHHEDLELEAPDELRLEVRESLGGSVPVLVAKARADFVSLVRAFLCRNEPKQIPDSMGACLVKGLNNWDRVWHYRRSWEAHRETPPSEADWKREFKALLQRRDEYQDRLVILGQGPYSGVAAEELGVGEVAWAEDSLKIRREHELTHYFVYRMFGSLRQNAQDELIADFVALVRSVGEYRGSLAMRFLGLERFPQVRPGGRIENYRGDPALSEPAMAVVRALAHRSTLNLERLAGEYGDALRDTTHLARVTLALAGLSLEELAEENLPERLQGRIDR